MSISKSETDVILNKANVALARSQRLVASWLPPQTSVELSSTKTEEELQREEDEIFTAVPETLGVGAPLPTKAADGSWNRTELDTNDQLRKQLLGKNYKKVMAAASNPATNSSSVSRNFGKSGGDQSKIGATGSANEANDDDDDEDGRTAAVGNKIIVNRRKAVLATTADLPYSDRGEGGDTNEEQAQDARAGAGPASGRKGRKKPTSFLDEILGERSKKRKKR